MPEPTLISTANIGTNLYAIRERRERQPEKRKAGRGTMNVGVTKLQWNYNVAGYKSGLAATHNTHSTG
jgi:hypothetical protein